MGAACTTGMTAFSRSASHPVKVLIIGKQSAGKTFLFYSWKYGVDSIVSVEPTSHFNVDTISSRSGHKFLIYDLAGNIGMRLRPFLEGTNGVVYVFGPHDGDSYDEEELDGIQQLLHERDLESVPFLFVMRKGSQMTEVHHDLPEKVQNSLEGRVWDLVDIRPYCQEDADLVLKILETLFIKSHTISDK